MSAGWGNRNLKQGLACIDKPLHGLCSRTVLIYFKMFNFSTSLSSILGCFAPSIIIEASIISSRPDKPTCYRHSACTMPWSPWTIGERGLASTTQGGIDAPEFGLNPFPNSCFPQTITFRRSSNTGPFGTCNFETGPFRPLIGVWLSAVTCQCQQQAISATFNSAIFRAKMKLGRSATSKVRTGSLSPKKRAGEKGLFERN